MMGTDCKAQVPTLPAAWPRPHWPCSSLSLTQPALGPPACTGVPTTCRPVHVGRCPWESFHSYCLGTRGPTSASTLGMGTAPPPTWALTYPRPPGCSTWGRVSPAIA